ncbi:monovalent cation/proton antiporter, MnhG/PhaG subunit [Oceaniovalibus guishaninsula JLT2003]|uniref:Monovalent cation/proton antiporter, MnhG/PhaG subunit n=1 Tax=Oceaniovalibus guishaninsula JLT2003 TaxID=1231392 RepID=K2I677_9RHOB|nr:Na+/H+ antiporter subunit G [Oceaniovalibus guishaninsula]EKE44490.1 monovalent cation/proton antiporter, MnhG/PhaG subunit [Oceaniovalibus guishaninsula JLT2003]
MTLFLDIVAGAALIVASIFGLVGSYGLVRLPDAMQRLHAPTKATTLGVGGVLIASMVYYYRQEGTLSFHELMITAFLILTAPVTANFIAKAHMHRNIPPEDLPPTGTDRGWASFDDPPAISERTPGEPRDPI